MKLEKLVSIGIALLIIQACSHPIEIEGDGDVASANRTCLLEDFDAGEDNCTKNYVLGAYEETYAAMPRVGSLFHHWENYCPDVTNNECAFSVSAATVQQFWGQTVPPLRAVFAKYKLTGPVLPDSDISIAPGYLASVGYQGKEYFFEGNARSYTSTLPLPSDGKLLVTPEPETVEGNYKTRLVVFRPIDEADFNGTVIVEWFNVTAQFDSSPDWIMAHNEFIREGYAYVGVSAQAVGVNALKGGFQAVRYSSLMHPGDSYSYDIFSRAGLLVGDESATLFGGFTVDRVIATGESQSASRMVTYINAVHPLSNVYDGFMVHSRGSSGSWISQAPLPSISYPSPAPIRDDLIVPVMVMQAEGDVIRNRLATRQPDTSMFRMWELAGTAHADTYTLVGLNDPGDETIATEMFQYMRTPTNFGCTSPINAGPHYLQAQAAFHALDTWVRDGVAPPIAPLLDVLQSSPTVVLNRDANGNALGGVRSPHVDVAVATLIGGNSGPSFCRLFGSTIPLTVGEINALYANKADFMTQWVNAINVSVANGFIRQADAGYLETAADAWAFPN